MQEKKCVDGVESLEEKESLKEIFTISEAAEYAHILPQSIRSAVKRGFLKSGTREHVYPNGTKQLRRVITLEDLDEYRKKKFLRDKLLPSGEKVYEMNKGRFSALQIAKIISTSLRRPYTQNKIRQAIRTGELKAHKVGFVWVITKQSMMEYKQKEIESRKKK